MKKPQKTTRLFDKGYMHGYGGCNPLKDQKSDYNVGYLYGLMKNTENKLARIRILIDGGFVFDIEKI